MKKYLLLSCLLTILLTQCKKETAIDDYLIDRGEYVPVRYELSLDDSKTDFSNLFPNGEMMWGNDSIEYLYLAVDKSFYYYDARLSKTKYVGELFELTAKVTGPTRKLVFTGMIPLKVIKDGREYKFYYFGNQGYGGTGTNVTNKYHSIYTNCLIGKTISFSNQTGDINELGKFHIASGKVVLRRIADSNNNFLRFEFYGDILNNDMAIAMLDVRDVTYLMGEAGRVQTFSVEWKDTAFIESCTSNMFGINVKNNVGEKSLIALLPTKDSVTIETDKGILIFKDGVEKNRIYAGSIGNSLEESTPLEWGDY